ncbi:hypothetical protein D3C76_1566100 [compost metagenome]
MCVAKVVETYFFDTSFPDENLHSLCDHFRFDIPPGGVAADEVVILVGIPVFVLKRLDLFIALLQIVQDGLKQLDPIEWSHRLWSLDNEA